MNLFSETEMIDVKHLFFNLFNAGTEEELDTEIAKRPEVFENPNNWKPLGGNDNNFGVIENQQSSPIAALIEKITNSIDAILMRECLKRDIEPKSRHAPQTIDDAINYFFPTHRLDWDLPKYRKEQAEDIQIVADGPPRNTSVIIYDNGEGQHPKKFEDTFLSLLRGNKNEIHFVQGKYNMGGSGAIVFCGKKGYQLIASKRYDNTGLFGFTLIRQHPLSKAEEKVKKNTWYEYFVIDEKIPAFPIEKLDLKLHNKQFTTGTIIKLYSYQFPSGYSGFAQELNQSINEFLFEPALPLLTVDNEKRYPNNKVLVNDLFGLKRRLDDDRDYLDGLPFSEEYEDELFGKMKVTCFVFKAKVKGWDVAKTKKVIQDRFFKNRMSVLFSMNGQVHGHYTSEFITRSLQKNILKNHLLIHVDCTRMNYNFRKELFMASRDRLKDGRETRALRKFLADKLGSASGQIAQIAKRRKDSISVSGESTKELLRDFTKNLPVNNELRELLGNAFSLEDKKKKEKNLSKDNKNKPAKEKPPFRPKRYPSYLKLDFGKEGEMQVAKIPLGGERTLKFETDVENEYFDRLDDPGELQIAILDYRPKNNDSEGGNAPGKPNTIEEVLNVTKSSPDEGTIRVVLSPKKAVHVGDTIKVKVTLTDKGINHDQIFLVKISEPRKKPTKQKEDESIEAPLGLPTPILVYQNEKDENSITWKQFEENIGESMDWAAVMYLISEGDTLESIYINMDSKVLKNFKGKERNISEEQVSIAEKKYISSVYFHTLFLYTITKKRKYTLSKDSDGSEEPVDISDYIRDLFDSYYSDFILNFGTVDLMESLS